MNPVATVFLVGNKYSTTHLTTRRGISHGSNSLMKNDALKTLLSLA